jgi:uncharacterized membrane protein (DUF485 family)
MSKMGPGGTEEADQGDARLRRKRCDERRVSRGESALTKSVGIRRSWTGRALGSAPSLFGRRYEIDVPIETDVVGGTPVDVSTLKRIEADSNYQKLVSERKTFGWTLAIITLVLYYGYIAIVAFAPGVIAQKVSGDITIGIIMGVALILLSILLTGIYVIRANGEYDDLTNAIVNAAKLGGKK